MSDLLSELHLKTNAVPKEFARQFSPATYYLYEWFDEIIIFMDSAEDNDLFSEFEGKQSAFDAAILMKVLPKFHGARGRLEAPLKEILGWCFNPDLPDVEVVNQQLSQVNNDGLIPALSALNYIYPKTAKRVIRLLWSLYTTGFAAFG